MPLSITVQKTNYFFLEHRTNGSLLAVDAGWPCGLLGYMRAMKAAGLAFRAISHAVVTHFHLDHAGLIGEFAERGISCLIFENQLGAIDAMEATITKNGKEYAEYRPIPRQRLLRVSLKESGALLGALGFDGECFLTDGHSVDSISLVTSERDFFVGDLPPPDHVMEADAGGGKDWREIRRRGGGRIFPSHAPPFEFP